MGFKVKNAVVAVGAVALALAGFAAGIQTMRLLRPDPVVYADSHVLMRETAVNAQLGQIGPRYALLVGDSHVELAYLPILCGMPTVNAGIGGGTAAGTAEVLDRLSFRGPPELVVLTIGANDARLKDPTALDGHVQAFRAASGALLDRLAKVARRVIVTDIPPMEPELAKTYPPTVLKAYTDVLEEHCRSGACTYVDLFGTAGRLRYSDGVHLMNYDRLYRRLEKTVCSA